MKPCRALLLPLLAAAACQAAPLPIRGLHLSAPKTSDVPLLVRFIREALPKEGVNTLVLEVNYRYQFKKHTEVIDADPLSAEDAAAITAAAKAAGVRIIPQISLLGHQSWAKTTFGLLRSHPEFDETPGKYPDNKDIYCRSYCPLHPGVHEVVLDLVDEVVAAFQADAFHAGMDEVFLLGEEDCPRCKGRLTSELFAGEVTLLRDHLAKSGKRLWIWGDRLIDGAATGAGKWEGSFNGTWPAIDRIPRDVLICDWHYDEAIPAAAQFAAKGFEVVSCPWRKPEVALAQIDLIRSLRAGANAETGNRVQGLLQTTWTDSGAFMRAYFGEASESKEVTESVDCFRKAFAQMRDPRDEILAVVLKSAADWSRGDLAAYLESYEQAPETTFVGTAVAHGTEAVAKRFRTAYPDAAHMGKTTFSELEVRQLNPDLAIVTGRFLVERSAALGGNKRGIFTLVMRRTPAGWRAIHDHSSATE